MLYLGVSSFPQAHINNVCFRHKFTIKSYQFYHWLNMVPVVDLSEVSITFFILKHYAHIYIGLYKTFDFCSIYLNNWPFLNIKSRCRISICFVEQSIEPRQKLMSKSEIMSTKDMSIRTFNSPYIPMYSVCKC